jgi:probable F420-dependent oxidoreductase
VLFDALVPNVAAPGAAVARQERVGAGAAWATETTLDPFVQLGDAAAATSRIRLGTAIAVAFARSPMTLAVTANHLQLVSEGRLLLGLGTQVQAHVERRFSMPWGKPVARMREYVRALRAIWDAWQTGERLDFRGEFYEHSVLPPLFNPGPNPYGPPLVYLAGVRDPMVRVAGEVADGFLAPPLASPAFLRERQLPALAEGWAGAHDGPVGPQVVVMPLVATGADQAELDAAAEATRARIAFYASTPDYVSILELHGWGGVGERLGALVRAREWPGMAALVSDEMLETIAVVAPPSELLAAVEARYAGLAARAILYPVEPLSEDVEQAVFAARAA